MVTTGLPVRRTRLVHNRRNSPLIGEVDALSAVRSAARLSCDGVQLRQQRGRVDHNRGRWPVGSE